MAGFTNIYGLVDPSTNSLRYVGKTVKTIEHRLRQHINSARAVKLQRVSRWIRGLLLRDVLPEAFLIETCLTSDWVESEQFWIAYYRSIGCDLVNSTNGGEGCVGFKHSDEVKAHLLEHLNNPDVVPKRIEGMKRSWVENPERKQLLSEQTKKRYEDPLFVIMVGEKIKAAHTANDHSGKMSAMKREWWADNDNRASVSAKMRESFDESRRDAYSLMARSWMAIRKDIYDECLTLAHRLRTERSIDFVLPKNVTQHSTKFWEEQRTELLSLLAVNDNEPVTAQDTLQGVRRNGKI